MDQTGPPLARKYKVTDRLSHLQKTGNKDASSRIQDTTLPTIRLKTV